MAFRRNDGVSSNLLRRRRAQQESGTDDGREHESGGENEAATVSPDERGNRLRIGCRRRRDGRRRRSHRGGAAQHIVDFRAGVADVAQSPPGAPCRRSGSGAAEWGQVSQGAAPTSPARDRESRRSCPRACLPRTRLAPSASRTTRIRTPRCRSACRPPCPVPVLDSCRQRCRGSLPPCVIAGVVIVGDCDTLGDEPSVGSIALARPKSNTFTMPSRRTLMFAGFKSRWMIPCSCAASSASAICFAMDRASSTRNRPLRDSLGERRPSTSSITSAVTLSASSKP